MRTYSIVDYPLVVRKSFDFLINEYGMKVEEYDQGLSYVFIYSSQALKVYLNYDMRDNFFYFKLIRGINTPYPNDHDFENIKPIYRLAQKYESRFNPKRLQPDDNQYKDSLQLNAEILKKYGDKILKGEEWF